MYKVTCKIRKLDAVIVSAWILRWSFHLWFHLGSVCNINIDYIHFLPGFCIQTVHLKQNQRAQRDIGTSLCRQRNLLLYHLHLFMCRSTVSVTMSTYNRGINFGFQPRILKQLLISKPLNSGKLENNRKHNHQKRKVHYKSYH